MIFFACCALSFKTIITRFIIIVLLCCPHNLMAQLWTGNLGLPILNTTFGAGAATPLQKNTSIYNYQPGCPDAGNYTLDHFLFGCQTGTWIMLTGDHTGDHNGNYMLVNGANTKGTVYVDTIFGLCGNTTYQFAAFVANCLKSTACGGNPVLTNLTLSIETVTGTVLASYATGNIATSDSKIWVQYGTYCTTPPASIPLVVRITNNSGGTCGSAFVLDDITFQPAGSAINVTVNNSALDTINLCTGYTGTYNLQGTYSPGYINPVLQWQYSIDTGITWKDIAGADNANYLMPQRNDSVLLFHLGVSEKSNAGNTKCTIYSNTIWTGVHALPGYIPLQKVGGCFNKDLVLKTSPDFSDYLWTKPSGIKTNDQWLKLPAIQYQDAGLYIVKLTGNFGCFIQDSFRVTVSPGTTIFTPTLYNICQGSSINLSATGNGFFTWTPAYYLSDTTIGTPVATPLDSIEYKVVLTNSFGCKDSAWININVFKKPVANAGADKTILLGDSTLLDGNVQGTAVNFYCTSLDPLLNSSLLTPAVSPVTETQYTLHTVSTLGCGNASSTTTIKVFKEVFMPSAFTPNGDGINDIYYVTALAGFKIQSFTIFNRYGSKVFATTNAAFGWDGTIKGHPQQTGEYFYYLEIINPSGKNINKKGSILLLR